MGRGACRILTKAAAGAGAGSDAKPTAKIVLSSPQEGRTRERSLFVAHITPDQAARYAASEAGKGIGVVSLTLFAAWPAGKPPRLHAVKLRVKTLAQAQALVAAAQKAAPPAT